VRRVRLTTKLLLSLLAISSALTSATLLTVRYTVERRVRESISEDLRKSVNSYRSFARQREDMLQVPAVCAAGRPAGLKRHLEDPSASSLRQRLSSAVSSPWGDGCN